MCLSASGREIVDKHVDFQLKKSHTDKTIKENVVLCSTNGLGFDALIRYKRGE